MSQITQKMHSNLDCVFVYFYVIIYPLQFFFITFCTFPSSMPSVPYISLLTLSFHLKIFLKVISVPLRKSTSYYQANIQFSTMRIILLQNNKKKCPQTQTFLNLIVVNQVGVTLFSGNSPFLNMQSCWNVLRFTTTVFFSFCFFCTKLCNVLKDL